ncbi:putative oxidoreductase [Actinoplanes missouriensis 431]|uniref:Putative oxidoreductase n=1 Tax=Actinoplanes missouriensis (strain ATCC 14538 / DSM 43046 / CBS 188.64 / JCM 3121 / NBRC 102363 / NCIMB 12654 / NRRL B-3342 / UNCC 431) TaxID=512565 RepID=I0HC99_ACTM4|nr:zinc-binding alcohol dehydrogenase [Actinoplanes missouriensis]BAL90636.1 putative oxidoreductase [Actinoplanes missouriensis 431]
MSDTEQNLIVAGPGRLEIAEVPHEEVPDGGFRARTLFSGISAGTELTFLKGTNPALHAGFDTALGLFGAPPEQAYPVNRLGYMEVARIEESRTPAYRDGTVVAMTYGHRTAYIGDPLRDRVVVLPEDLDPVLGIYAAHMGPICANGLLHAAADRFGPAVRSLGDGVLGARVAVVGAGVVGLLTALLARQHGAASVVILDPTPQRRAIAEALGIETLDSGPDADDPAVVLKTRWRHADGDRGADVVFQCRGQAAALHLGLRLLRPQGTVIDLAFYPGGADEVRLGEEFHHNGLGVRCAQIGRVPRGLAHSWDRERLSAATLDLLRADGGAIRDHLVTAVVPFAEGPAVLAGLADRTRQELQVVLSF